MRMLIGFCVGAVLTTTAFAAPVAPLGVILWKNIRAGMTEAQLIAAVPGLQKGRNGSEFVAPNAVVVGISFGVGIEMRNARVARVSLFNKDANPAQLADTLSAKYGSPATRYKCDTSMIYMCEGSWRGVGGSKITLSHVEFSGGGANTTITYEAFDTRGI